MDISTQIGGYMVFYTELETDETTNKISSKLKNKIVPLHLKEQFLQRYGRKVKEMSMTAQEIDYFLEQNS
jgi:tagatose-1,6-bisphosphate aldolase non-catalytic subunit AgaZ/GatZ